MRRIASTITILFQIVLTFIVLFCIYMIYAVMEVIDIDFITIIGFAIFQPLFGGILTTLTIGLCLVAGIPIRMMKGVRAFWLRNPWLPLLGTIAGLLLLVLAPQSRFAEIKEVEVEWGTVKRAVPNMVMSGVGWFLTAFSLLHFYPQSLSGYFRFGWQRDVAER